MKGYACGLTTAIILIYQQISPTWAKTDTCPTCTADDRPALLEFKSNIEDLKSALAQPSPSPSPKPVARVSDESPLEPAPPGKSSWLRGTFVFDSLKKPDRILAFSANYWKTSLSNEELSKVNSLYFKLLGTESNSPSTYSAYKQVLASDGATLSKDAKLALLSIIGSALVARYDNSVPGSATSFDLIFANLRAAGSKGGVCRDIHDMLSDMAKTLGFEYAGTQSGIESHLKSPGVAHVISRYRDAKTGEYYLQDYNFIVNTRQKTIPDTLNFGARLMGPLTNTVLHETQSGAIRLHQTNLGVWIQDKIEKEAGQVESRVNLDVSPQEQTVSGTFQHELNSHRLKGFIVLSRYDASDGPYELAVAGVAKNYEKKTTYEDRLLDEVGYKSMQYAGGLYLKDSRIIDYSKEESYFAGNQKPEQANTIFAGWNLKGWARINEVTGFLEIKTHISDFGADSFKTLFGKSGYFDATFPIHKLSAGAKIGHETPVALEVSRTHQVTTERMTSTKLKLNAAYDKINVIVDLRSQDRKVYLQMNNELYLFDGWDRMSAEGIRNKIKAAVKSDNLGEFYVFADHSRIISNKSGDPYFELPASLRLGAGWERAINKTLQAGAKIEKISNPPTINVFQTPGIVTPELNTERKNETRFQTWLRVRF